jgi:hypothetical protein
VSGLLDECVFRPRVRDSSECSKVCFSLENEKIKDYLESDSSSVGFSVNSKFF